MFATLLQRASKPAIIFLAMAAVLFILPADAFAQTTGGQKDSGPAWVIGYALFLLGVFLCVFSIVRPGKRSFEIPELE